MGLPEDILRFEQLLQELTIKYEQYFVGIEKREPLPLLAEVEQYARRYQSNNITNTMLRFKYSSLLSTLCSQRSKWARINRLIEEGRYERDKFKMALRSRSETPMQDALRSGQQPSAPSRAEQEMDKLYREYLEARQRCNLPTENVSREKMAALLTQQSQALTSKYRCAAVEFRVVVEEGKPRIKARPKNA